MEQHSPNEMPSGAFIEYVFLSKCFSHHLIKCFLFYHSLHLNTFVDFRAHFTNPTGFHMLENNIPLNSISRLERLELDPGPCGPSSKRPKREANQLLMTDYIMLMNPKQRPPLLCKSIRESSRFLPFLCLNRNRFQVMTANCI